MSQRVIVVGAGGHGQVVVDILQAMKSHDGCVEPLGFVDDDPSLHGATLLGVPVFGTTEALRHIVHDAIIVAIGNNDRRRTLTTALIQAGERLATAVHPSAVVSRHASIGSGSMVCAGAIVNPQTVVGHGVILNTGCSIDHHCQLGDYVHIAPGARLGGSVMVGHGAFVGIGAAVLPGCRIGAGAIVGAGAAVTSDVTDGSTAVGVPAKVM